MRPTKPAFYPLRESALRYHGAWPLIRTVVHAVGAAPYELPPEDAERLRVLARSAAILTPNHPTPAEGPTLYLIGHKLRHRYIHCGAHEIYSQLGPFGPHLLSAACFSICRRAVDFPAYNTARSLLAARRNLVLFPEGELSGMSDRLLPFERGAAQIAFWSIAPLHAAHPDAPLYLVPIAIKYRETGDAPGEMRASLQRLEERFVLPPTTEHGALWRLHRIEDAFLAAREAELGLPVEPAGSFDARWTRLRAALEIRAAIALGVPSPDAELTVPQRARELLTAWNEAWDRAAPRKGGTVWTELRRVHADIALLNRFMGFDENYVAAWPSVERFGDYLRRIEVQVFGRHHFRYRRIGRVRVGAPLDVAPLLADYRRDKRAMVATVTADLKSRIAGLLDALTRELTVPWPAALDPVDRAGRPDDSDAAYTAAAQGGSA